MQNSTKLSSRFYFLLTSFLFLVISVFVFLPSSVHAATSSTWTNASSTNSNWSNPDNWDNNTVPSTTSDIAIFDDSDAQGNGTTTDATLDINVDVKEIQIKDGYSATVTSTGNVNVTTSLFKQNESNSGFSATGISKFDVNGNMTINSGTVSSTSNTTTISGDFFIDGVDGSYNHNGGIVKFDGSNTQSVNINTFNLNTTTIANDVKVKNSGFTSDEVTVKSGNTFNWQGQSIDIDVLENKGVIKLHGGNTLNGSFSFDSDSGTTTFYSSVTKNIKSDSGQAPYHNVKFNDSSGTWTLSGDTTVNGNLTISSGTFDDGGNKLTLKGDWDNQDTASLSGTTTFKGSNNQQITSSGSSFNNFVLDNSGSGATTTDKLVVSKDLDIKSGALEIGSNNLDIAGNLFISATGGTGFKSSATTTFNGSNTQSVDINTFNLNTTTIANDVKVKNSGFTSDEVTVKSGNKFDWQGQDIDIDTLENKGVIKLHGGNTLNGNFSFDSDSGTTTYDGNVSVTIAGKGPFNNIKFDNSGGSWTLPGDTTVNGDLTVAQGTFDDGGNKVTLKGDWDNQATASLSGTTTFKGTGSSDIYTNGTNDNKNFNNLVFNDSGDWTLQNNDLAASGTLDVKAGTLKASGNKSTIEQKVTVSGGTYNAGTAKQTFAGGLTVSGGTLDGGSSGDIDIDGTVDLSSGSFKGPGATVTVSGTWKNGSNNFDEDTNSPKVKFDATSGGPYNINESGAFYDLTIAGSETYNIKTNNLTTDNNLTISGGTLDASANSKNITVKGNWNRTSGDFKEGTQKVTFNNGSATQKIKSNETFSKLVLDNSGNTVEDTSSGITANTTTVKSGTFKPAGGATFKGKLTINGTLTPKGNLNIKADFDNDSTFNPGSNTVTFNGSNTQNVDIDNDSFNNVTIDGNTVRISTNTLDIDGNLKIQNSGGSLDANTNNLNVELAGDWNGDSNDGSDFDEGSGNERVVFDSGSNKQTIKNSETFNELLIDNTHSSPEVSSTAKITVASTTVKNGTFQPYDDSDFNGNVTINSGSTLEALSTTTLMISGDFDNSGSFVGNSGTTTFDGSSDSSVTSSGSSFNHLKFANSTTTIKDNLGVGGDLTIASGAELDSNSQDITVSSSWKNSSGDFVEGSNKVTFDGTGGTHNIDENGAFNDFTFTDSGGTWNLASSLDVNGDVALNNGTLDSNSNNITVAGGWETNSGKFSPNSDKVTFDGGSGTHTIKPADGTDFHNMEVSGGATYELSSYALDVGNQLKVTSGKLGKQGYDKNIDINGKLIASGGSVTSTQDILNITGNMDLDGTTFYHNSGTTTFDGSGNQKVTSSGQTFNSTTISNTATVIPQDNWDIDGKLKTESGTTLDLTEDKNVTTKHDVVINGSVNKGTGVWTFDGSGTNTLDANGANTNLGEIKIDGNSKIIQLANTKAHVTTATIKSDDELDLNGQGLEVDNDVKNNNIVKLQGDENVTISGNYDNDSGTTTYSGAQVDTTIPDDLTTANNVTFDHSATWTLPSDMDLEGNLYINNGTLDIDDAADNKITLAGDWDSSGGNFKYRDGLVEFDGGDQSILGSEFNELKKVVSNTSTFELPSSETTTVHETTTLKATGGSTLNLRSTSSTDANFAIDKYKQELHHVDVRDVDASVSNTIYCVDDCTDSGNASSKNWVFSVDITFDNPSQSGNEINNKKFKVSLSEPYFIEPVTVDFSDNGLQATANQDYTFSDSSLTIAQGDQSAYTSKLLTLDDSQEEGDEDLEINLDQIASPTSYNDLVLGSTSTLTYTILANDVPTDSGGGGGSSLLIRQGASQQTEESLKVNINDGASVTTQREVEVKIEGENIEQTALSNSPDFENKSFQDYKEKVDWKLESGSGDKTVYVKIKTDRETFTRTDDIRLVKDSSDTVVKEDDSRSKTQSVSCPLEVQKPYTIPNDNSVTYVTRNCTLRDLDFEEKYFSYFHSWDAVKEVSPQTFSQIPRSSLGFMPWGPLKNLKAGTLFKTVDDPKVNLLLGNGKKCWIKSQKVFNALHFDMSNLVDVHPKVKSNYRNCSTPISNTQHHPPHVVIKGKNSKHVYKLVPNSNGSLPKKRRIVDMQAFEALGYKRKAIVEVPQQMVNQYPSGNVLGEKSENDILAAANVNKEQETGKVNVNYTFNRYLKRGSKGEEVEELQRVLNEMGYYNEVANGYYDLETVEAVQSFQEDEELEPVGVVGPSTRGILNSM